jgi:hypothetical protein
VKDAWHSTSWHNIAPHAMQATLTQLRVPHVAASQMHVVFASSKSLYKGFCVLQQYCRWSMIGRYGTSTGNRAVRARMWENVSVPYPTMPYARIEPYSTTPAICTFAFFILNALGSYLVVCDMTQYTLVSRVRLIRGLREREALLIMSRRSVRLLFARGGVGVVEFHR